MANSNSIKFIKTFTIEEFKEAFAVSKVGICPSDTAENGVCLKIEFADNSSDAYGAVSKSLTREDIEGGTYMLNLSLTQFTDHPESEWVWMLHKEASGKEIVFEL